MKINDFISITELSRLTGKSRPTLYKYVAEYERGRTGELPLLMLNLVRLIDGGCAKSQVYRYCEENFAAAPGKKSATDEEILSLIRAHRDSIDIEKLKKFLEEHS